MEPKFKELVKRDPNVDLTNILINEWPTEEKIKTIAAGMLYALGNSTDWNKLIGDLRKGLQLFSQRWNELKQYHQENRDMRRTPAGGYKLTDDPAYKLHRHGGKA